MAASEHLIDLIIRHPYRMMLFSLALIVALGAGTSRLHVDSGIEIFFAADDPNLLAERELQATYGREENILFIVDSGEGTIFRRDHLAAIEKITERAWLMPSAKRVDSPTNFLHPSVDGDDIVIAPLVEDALSLEPPAIAAIRDIASSEKALVGRLLGPEGDIAAVNVNLLLPRRNMGPAIAESVAYARKLAAEVQEEHPQLRIHLAGWALTEQTLVEVTTRDSTTLMPLLLLLVLGLLALLLRSLLASLVTIVALTLSIATGMGFAGWAGIGLNSVNVSAPTIILTLAVADCIHVLSAFLRALRTGSAKQAALANALRKTLYPVALTSVTTALGFLTLNFSESPPFRELGNIAAVGVVGALWVTLTILPGLVMMLPFRSGRRAGTGLPMAGLARFVTEPPATSVLGISRCHCTGGGRHRAHRTERRPERLFFGRRPAETGTDTDREQAVGHSEPALLHRCR